jgi:ABC-type Fe3+ transport system substrate-binding protein
MKKLLLLLLGACTIWACKPESKSKVPPPAVSNTNNLTIFSHRYLLQDQQLFATYRARANKAVDVYRYPSESIIELAKNGQLKGDLVILDDLYHAHLLKKTGVLQPYSAGTFDELVPSRYIDNEGYWAGLTRWAMGFVYDPQKVDMIQMRNYAGVLDARYRGKVVMAHPDSSGLVSMVAAMIAAYGEEPARIYLEKLNDNLMLVPSGTDWEAVTAVIDGQADIAFVNTSDYLRHRNSGNVDIFQSTSRLAWEIPKDAKGNNYYNITPICLLKDTRYRDYAISMIEFLTVQENQNFYADPMIEYTVNIFAEQVSFLNDAFNVAQGRVTSEMAENQLDKSRELIRAVMGI